MSRHWLAWPQRAHLVGGLVADGKHKAEMRCIRAGELIPGLAASIRRVQSCVFDLTEGFRPNRSGRVTSGAVRGESWLLPSDS